MWIWEMAGLTGQVFQRGAQLCPFAAEEVLGVLRRLPMRLGRRSHASMGLGLGGWGGAAPKAGCLLRPSRTTWVRSCCRTSSTSACATWGSSGCPRRGEARASVARSSGARVALPSSNCSGSNTVVGRFAFLGHLECLLLLVLPADSMSYQPIERGI